MKKTIIYSVCYLLTFLVVLWCGKFSKSGPCTIGFDIISWFFAMLVSAILIIINLTRAIRYRKKEIVHILLVNVIGGILLLGMGLIHA